MKKNFFLCFLPFLFFSCASVHLPIPGEEVVKKNNIAVEYMTIADAYTEQSKYSKAIDYYKLAMKNKKLYWSALYKLARAYALDKNWAESEKNYKKLYERDSSNISIAMSLAYVTAINGNLSASKTMYESLKENNPDNAEIAQNYISVLIATEDFENANAEFILFKEKFKDNSKIADFEKILEEKLPSPEEPLSDEENTALAEQN